jgi:hypothetical protein
MGSIISGYCFDVSKRLPDESWSGYFVAGSPLSARKRSQFAGSLGRTAESSKRLHYF